MPRQEESHYSDKLSIYLVNFYNDAVKTNTYFWLKGGNIDAQNGTASALGWSTLTIGNNTAEGTAKNSKASLKLYGAGTGCAALSFGGGNTDRNFVFPNAAGTLALTDDLPSREILNVAKNAYSSRAAAFNYVYSWLISHVGSTGSAKYYDLHIHMGGRVFRYVYRTTSALVFHFATLADNGTLSIEDLTLKSSGSTDVELLRDGNGDWSFLNNATATQSNAVIVYCSGDVS